MSPYISNSVIYHRINSLRDVMEQRFFLGLKNFTLLKSRNFTFSIEKVATWFCTLLGFRTTFDFWFHNLLGKESSGRRGITLLWEIGFPVVINNYPNLEKFWRWVFSISVGCEGSSVYGRRGRHPEEWTEVPEKATLDTNQFFWWNFIGFVEQNARLNYDRNEYYFTNCKVGRELPRMIKIIFKNRY